MRTCRLLAMIAAAVALASADGGAALAASPMSVKRDGSLEIGGRKMRCGRVRISLPRRLPNLGVAGPGMIALNPALLSHYPETVRLFVFAHECGHHHVGGDELAADCWGVHQGVREGWLDKNGLGQVCRSFGNEPASDTHPSGKRRCGNLDRCFASALAASPKPPGATASAGAAGPGGGEAGPQLLEPPTVVGSGRMPAAGRSSAAKPTRGQGYNAAR